MYVQRDWAWVTGCLQQLHRTNAAVMVARLLGKKQSSTDELTADVLGGKRMRSGSYLGELSFGFKLL